MKLFDFKYYHEKLLNTSDFVEKLRLRREMFLIYDALEKDEQKDFKHQLNKFLHVQSDRIRQELLEIEASI